uniref:Uncharacterized protein LOC113795688 n=1 Tax=Dermatophagoides pteronyssinus TaxID=6956 RepID=A0A6P6Y9S5_DERPT|nr:uncharacterized protein LOC113795688 [Dermatophagoides pteronyssinus]
MDQQILETFLKQSTTKPIYKQYLPFMKLARDSFAQNPILTYWTLCYVVEAALKNQTKPTDDFRKFLLEIMSCLEKEKKSRIGDNSAASKPKDDRQIQLEKELSSLTLSESDSKRAELLCESALYAIRANDLLTAVDTLKQTIELLYKRAKK